jgi:hypothetical protein
MNQVATQQKLGAQVVISSGENGFAVTPQTLSDIVEFAKFMCQSNAGIPAYLRGNAPDCAAITMQALKWNFDPFSVAQKSYKVKDVLAYEAQLIAAVVNTRSGIKGRLKYFYDGEGSTLTCTVTGILDGEEYSYTSPPVGSITTKNSPLWKTDPQQQLGYYSARSWARRYTPEVLLGVYDRDEAEEFRGPERAKDITPAFDPFSDNPIPTSQESTDAHDGFDMAVDQPETENVLTGEILTNDDNFNSGSTPSEPVNAEVPSPASAASDDAPSSPSSDAPLSDADLRKHLMDLARNAFSTLSNDELDEATKSDIIEEMIGRYKADVIHKSQWAKMSSVTVAFKAVFAGKRSIDEARSYVAIDVLDCSTAELGGAA